MIREFKTVKISLKRQISIPRAFRQFKEGRKAILIAKGDELILKPFNENMTETALLTEKLLAESWLSEEDEQAFKYLQ